MIDDLCANDDCQLSDECHPDFFETWEDWQQAHSGCYIDEDGRECNSGFYSSFSWNDETEKWIKK